MENEIINQIECNLLNTDEDKLKYLLDISFIYEITDTDVYNYIFYKVIDYIYESNIKNINLKFFDKKIILKSIYYLHYCDKKSIKGPLDNLIYVLSNYNEIDKVEVVEKMVEDYFEQLRLLILYFENKLGEKCLRLSL